MLYHPKQTRVYLDKINLPETQEIFLNTEDNIKIIAWYHPAKNHQKMVIFLHGNAGNLNNRISKLQKIVALNYGFIIPSWRGFGGSPGDPTIQGLYQDGKAAVKFLVDQGFKTENIIIIGESLGTGVASELALHHKFKGIFLITPYTSVAAIAQEMLPLVYVKPLVKDNFDNLSKIKLIYQPILIVHGTADKVVPYSHALKIFSAANEPKKLVTFEGAGHSNYDEDKAFGAMERFFEGKSNN